jgi:hypothetical protein
LKTSHSNVEPSPSPYLPVYVIVPTPPSPLSAGRTTDALGFAGLLRLLASFLPHILVTDDRCLLDLDSGSRGRSVVQLSGLSAGRARGWAAGVVLAPFILGACVTQYVRPPDVMVIHNHRPSTIQSLAWTSCDVPGETLRSLPDSTIAPRQTIEIPLLPGCVNLFALDSQGGSAGEQYDLRMQPGTTWRIQ